MRLEALDGGHSPGRKLQLGFMRLVGRREPPDIIKLIVYRRDFFGGPFIKAVHQALRGPSPWTVAERELIAAVVSQANECPFCVGSHGAVVEEMSGSSVLEATLKDPETAPISASLKAALRLVVKVTLTPDSVTVDNVRAAKDAGVSREALDDALHIAYIFNCVNRLANAFDFEVPSKRDYAADAKMLATIGYRL